MKYVVGEFFLEFDVWLVYPNVVIVELEKKSV